MTTLSENHTRTYRHPEKRNKLESKAVKKPPWIRIRHSLNAEYLNTRRIVEKGDLKTVCQEASCPNISECWSKKHATLMIMGGICTRGCAFCNIATGRPDPLNPFEPYQVANAISQLGLKHAVITSVDRDDLDDGGARHFSDTIKAVRGKNPTTSIEVLTPDFRGCDGALDTIAETPPDVFNHNLETVPRLYPSIRPGARYYSSLRLLDDARRNMPGVFTKSGLMVGLGETRDDVLQVMDDMRAAHVDFITIGQYLQPTKKHATVDRYVTPEEFDNLTRIAWAKGFSMVSCSPLTRSSYHAGEDFERLRAERIAKAN